MIANTEVIVTDILKLHDYMMSVMVYLQIIEGSIHLSLLLL